MSIKGKTAVVTSAAGNSALAIARALLEDGAQVALVDRDAMRLDSLIRFLRGTTAAVPCESSEAGAVREACQKVEKVLGPVDILVNCAESPPSPRLDATEPDEWRGIMGQQLDGAFFWCRAVIPSMRKRGEGRIVNVISLAAKNAGVELGPAVAAAHGGLASLTFALARETASQGITVNAIALGAIEGSAAVEPLNEAQRRQLLTQIPVGRFCRPEELAHAVRFLVSPLAGFVTGEIVDLNGGVLMD
jgi:3-oxoacyl-[acyl-carrier protein] reductase